MARAASLLAASAPHADDRSRRRIASAPRSRRATAPVPAPGTKPAPLVNLYNEHTHEWLAVDPAQPRAPGDARSFLRDHYTNKSTKMEPRLARRRSSRREELQERRRRRRLGVPPPEVQPDAAQEGPPGRARQPAHARQRGRLLHPARHDPAAPRVGEGPEARRRRALPRERVRPHGHRARSGSGPATDTIAAMSMSGAWSASGLARSLVLVAIHDLTQKRHAILRNFPIIGHFRYWLEAIGPELRQYIVTGNDEERPFSRDQRRWVYASSKKENNYFGFGTDNDLERRRLHPRPPQRVPDPHAARRRARLRPDVPAAVRRACSAACAAASTRSGRRRSSTRRAMSYGSLSPRGRRGDQPRRRARGRAAEHRRGRHLRLPPQGRRHHLADRHRLLRLPRRAAAGSRWSACSRAIASAQGPRDRDQALAGREARARRRAAGGEDHAGDRAHPRHPAGPRLHLARRTTPRSPTSSSMLDFIETLADATGLPVGIKTAVGDLGVLARRSPRRCDETGARARLHHDRRRRRRHRRRAARVHRSRRAAVQARLHRGLPRVRRGRRARSKVVFIGSGKLGFPETGAARARARLRHDQRRARGDAGDRLHPGAALPHRPLPDRRRDAEQVARCAASIRR